MANESGGKTSGVGEFVGPPIMAAGAAAGAAAGPVAAGDLGAALGGVVPGVMMALAQKITINQLTAAKGKVAELTLGKITVGKATVGLITVTDAHVKLNGAQAFLKDVRTVLELRFTLHWKVDLGWLGSWDGVEDLGTLPFGLDVGNVSVPSLANIELDIPSLSIPGLETAIKPIENLDLGGGALSALLAKNTALPAAGFTLSGLGLAGLSVNGLAVPATSTEEVQLAEFKPTAEITLPGATLANVAVPSAQAGDINASAFNFSASASRRCLGVDLGILEVKVCVDPTVHLDVGSMRIEDVDLTAAVKGVDIEDVRFPITVGGIRMADVDLQTVNVDKVSLG
jgi:hypothetical protein